MHCKLLCTGQYPGDKNQHCDTTLHHLMVVFSYKLTFASKRLNFFQSLRLQNNFIQSRYSTSSTPDKSMELVCNLFNHVAFEYCKVQVCVRGCVFFGFGYTVDPRDDLEIIGKHRIYTPAEG